MSDDLWSGLGGGGDESHGEDLAGEGILATSKSPMDVLSDLGLGDALFARNDSASTGDRFGDLKLGDDWGSDVAMDGHQHFDPSQGGGEIIGNPGSDMNNWHLQDHQDTCAIVSQQFVIESLTGQQVSESDLMQDAESHGWYTPGGGTPLNDVGYLLEERGIHINQSTGNSLDDVAQQLQQGHKVIVGVNGEDIWGENGTTSSDTPLNQFPAIPGQQADHAVEVIGIDNSNPSNPMVILNDPGTPDGRGLEVPAAQFEQAWSTSDHYMVNTTDTAPASDTTTPASRTDSYAFAGLGGYYNYDGTYHWCSDGTDRDPDTGQIIREYPPI